MKSVLVLGSLALTMIASAARALTAEVTPTKASFILGEPIQFEIRIVNDVGDAAHFSLEAPEAGPAILSGKPQHGVEREAEMPGIWIGPVSFVTLSPGETYRKTYFLSDCRVRVRQPGTYHFDVQVSFAHPFNSASPSPSQHLPAKLSITVLSADQAVLAAQLDALKTAIFGGVYDFSRAHRSEEHRAQMRLLLHYTDPQSVPAAGEVYRGVTPEDKGYTIQTAQQNRELGRKYLETFDAATPENFSGLHQRIAQMLAGFDAMNKSQGTFR